MNNNRSAKYHPAKDIGIAPSTPSLFPQEETVENVFNEPTPSHVNSSFADISSTSTPTDYHVTQQNLIILVMARLGRLTAKHFDSRPNDLGSVHCWSLAVGILL